MSIDEAKALIRQKTESYERLQRSKEDLKQQIEVLNSEIGELRSRLAAMTDSAQTLEAEQGKLLDKVSRLDEELISKGAQITSHLETIDNLETKYTVLKASHERKTSELQDAKV